MEKKSIAKELAGRLQNAIVEYANIESSETENEFSAKVYQIRLSNQMYGGILTDAGISCANANEITCNEIQTWVEQLNKHYHLSL